VIFWEPPPKARRGRELRSTAVVRRLAGWRAELLEQLDRVLLGSCGRIQLFDLLAESPGQPAGLSVSPRAAATWMASRYSSSEQGSVSSPWAAAS